MRFYDVTISDPATNKVVRQWQSHSAKGVFNPNAQNIEFDIITSTYSTPMGGQAFQIDGIALQDLGNAQKFTGLTFTMRAGMQKGLPLANPAQIGVVTKGFIFQSYGNWQGVEMALNFVIYPSLYSFSNPGNIVLNLKAGQQLSTALTNTLAIAYPDFPPPVMNISPQRVAIADYQGHWPTLEGLAQQIEAFTQGQLGANDPGVFITIKNGQLNAYDASYSRVAKPIVFTDLIGQPTWIAVNMIVIKLVMRGDLNVGDLIQLQSMQNVPGMVLTSAESMPSSIKYQPLFTGKFLITDMRHIGNYRSPDSASWVTVITCVPPGG